MHKSFPADLGERYLLGSDCFIQNVRDKEGLPQRVCGFAFVPSHDAERRLRGTSLGNKVYFALKHAQLHFHTPRNEVRFSSIQHNFLSNEVAER